MAAVNKTSPGIHVVVWSITTGNSLLLLYYFFSPLTIKIPIVTQAVSFTAMAAVFPLDFFHAFLRELWSIHACWIIAMMTCAIGILRFNKWARIFFIILNIIHGVILSYIVIRTFGQSVFLDYFFKLYFNLVVVGAYVGYITIPEVRAQFNIAPGEMTLSRWLKRPRLKEPATHDDRGYYNLGLAYSRLERYEDAGKALSKSISINPNNAEFHYCLGMTYVKRKKYHEAVNALKEATRLDPVHFEAASQLGLVNMQQGCAKEAIAAFSRASHIQPNNPEVYHLLGQVYVSDERFQDALEAFQRAIELNPSADDAYFQRGLILMNQFERFGEAQEAFWKSIRLKPDIAQSHFQLGIVNIKLNRMKDAIRSFKEVIRLNKNHLQAHYQLGFTYALIKDYDSARREYKYLKKLDADLAGTLAMLIK